MCRYAQVAWFAALLMVTGCAQIKWAVKDVVEDVSGLDPDEQREVLRVTKRVALAPGRHGAVGVYATGGGGGDPETEGGGGEVGIDVNSYWWSSQLGIMVYGSTPADNYFIGPTARFRVQLPYRLTPFAGIGGFAGWGEIHRRDDDGMDDNDNGVIDDADEITTDSVYFASVFPEVGAHFWVNDRIRVSGSGSYYITTEGRDHDFWMASVSITLFLGNLVP